VHAMVESDAGLLQLSDEIEMLQQRLRTARVVLRERTAARDALAARPNLGMPSPPRSTKAAPAAGGPPEAPSGSTRRLKGEQMNDMMRRLVPSAHELATRPGLHPNSEKLFKSQGIEPAAPPKKVPAKAATKKVSDQAFVARLYEAQLKEKQAKEAAREQQREAELQQAIRKPVPLSKADAQSVLSRLFPNQPTADPGKSNAPVSAALGAANSLAKRWCAKRGAAAGDTTATSHSNASGKAACAMGAAQEQPDQATSECPRETCRSELPWNVSEEGELQFVLTVPSGYIAGDDLPVQLPDGRAMVLSVPDGLGPGDDFIALVPPG
jgi:hypothetical protein